jgi:hypothetical protein
LHQIAHEARRHAEQLQANPNPIEEALDVIQGTATRTEEEVRMLKQDIDQTKDGNQELNVRLSLASRLR